MSEVLESFDINRKPYLDLLLAHQVKELRPGFDYASTFLSEWDAMCRDDGGGSGLAMGWHVTLAGNPGHGKSVFAINLGAHAAAHGVAVGYVSLEMTHRQLAVRNLAIRTGTEVRYLERGSDYRHDKAQEAAARMLALDDEPFAVNDQAFHDVSDVLAVMADWKTHGVTLFIVDYMQLMGSTGVTGPEEVALVSRSIRGFAREHRVITLALSQFNRETSRNHKSPPTVQGLHGGMSMEADSDQVLMLDHSRYRRSSDGRGARTWLILGKNRHGPVGSIPIWLSYETLQVRQADPDEVDQWPKRARAKKAS